VYSPTAENQPAPAAAQQQQQQQQQQQRQRQNPGLALRPGQFLAAYRAAGTSGNGDGRRALIAEWVALMDAQLGPELVQVRLGASE
jgi:hypothetical protein